MTYQSQFLTLSVKGYRFFIYYRLYSAAVQCAPIPSDKEKVGNLHYTAEYNIGTPFFVLLTGFQSPVRKN